jgi:uncharacterized membrane protein YkvA (DUF1232 family)
MTSIWIGVIVAFVALFALLCAAGLLLWRTVDATDRQLIKRILRLRLKSQFRLAVALARDPRIPLRVRLIPPGLILYLAMPIDLIPDFIPVIGQLDDMIVVFVGVRLLLRFAPREVVEDHIARLEQSVAT